MVDQKHLPKLPPSLPKNGRALQPVRLADKAFLDQLAGFSLTTAEILYRLPDHPALLQSFVWQDYDLSPKFPKLLGFLDYWRKNLEGPLYQIRVAHAALIKPAEIELVNGEFRLN